MLVALVISSDLQRFERARDVLQARHFGPVIQMPAIWYKEKSRTCRGTEGHRMAMRNAWRAVETMRRACVFEDDIVSDERNQYVVSYVDATMASKTVDVLFLGDIDWDVRKPDKHHDFWTNHAQCISSDGARKLLNITAQCLPHRGLGVDTVIKRACERNELRCVSQKRFFGQDRHNVTPYLHDASNRYIGS